MASMFVPFNASPNLAACSFPTSLNSMSLLPPCIRLSWFHAVSPCLTRISLIAYLLIFIVIARSASDVAISIHRFAEFTLSEILRSLRYLRMKYGEGLTMTGEIINPYLLKTLSNYSCWLN